MLARENHLFGCTRSKPSQGSVPAGLTLASDFSFCFQCQAGPSLVLHRPIEITAFIVQVELRAKSGVQLTRLAGHKIVLKLYGLRPAQPLVAATSMQNILIEKSEDVVFP